MKLKIRGQIWFIRNPDDTAFVEHSGAPESKKNSRVEATSNPNEHPQERTSSKDGESSKRGQGKRT